MHLQMGPAWQRRRMKGPKRRRHDGLSALESNEYAANRLGPSILACQGPATTELPACTSCRAGGKPPRRPGRIASDEAMASVKVIGRSV